MYFWKCWHDSRDRFLTCLIGMSSLLTLLGWFVARQFSHATEAQLAYFWKDMAMLRVPLGRFLLPAVALCMAASGIGEEFATGAPGLLFTRPRKRRYFIWASWATGMLEMAAIIVLPMICAVLASVYHVHTITSWRFLSVFAYVLPVCAVVYGLSHFAAVLGKGARQGTAIALVVILAYIATVEVLSMRFAVQMPNWWLGNLCSASAPSGYVAALPIAGWLAFSLLFPWAAQCILERREI